MAMPTRDRGRRRRVASTPEKSLIPFIASPSLLPQTIETVCAVDAVGASQKRRHSGPYRPNVSNNLATFCDPKPVMAMVRLQQKRPLMRRRIASRRLLLRRCSTFIRSVCERFAMIVELGRKRGRVPVRQTHRDIRIVGSPGSRPTTAVHRGRGRDCTGRRHLVTSIADCGVGVDSLLVVVLRCRVPDAGMPTRKFPGNTACYAAAILIACLVAFIYPGSLVLLPRTGTPRFVCRAISPVATQVGARCMVPTSNLVKTRPFWCVR